MTGRDGDLAARIALIKQEYLARLQNEGVPNLRALRQRFLQTPADESVRNQLLHAAHDLNGSGAVFGYDEVSKAGKLLEDALRALIRQTSEDSAERHGEIVALVDRLDAACVAAGRDRKPSES